MSELVALDVEAARRLTERIRLIAQNVADNVEKLRELVQQAKESDAHVALGYASWTAYLTDVFGDEPLRLARDVRQELVAELAAQGMSSRAIAPIVGLSHVQVTRDVATVTSVTVDPATGEVDDSREIVGLNGKKYTATSKPVPLNTRKELALVNDIRLYLKHVGGSKDTATLSVSAKQHIIDALHAAIEQLERTMR